MKFSITTTLPYVNAQPHIGHALEFIQADVIARRRRLRGDDVHFNVGTDEHGLKIFEKAKENGMEIRTFVDSNVQTFLDFFTSFGVQYDKFYRTSDLSHYTVAQAFWNTCTDRGDIYKKTYEGLYCVGCESFKTEKDLVDGKCPDHGTAPIRYAEENYFFKLSTYRNQLLKYIEETNFVQPAHKNKELANFVEQMEDISISRKKENLPRGVPVPGDETQVMYVRFDALTNYVGTVGYPDDMGKVAEFRGDASSGPRAVQICGPDNLRFQGAIWQGMLCSAQIPFTKKLLVHGMILGPDGNKMSKTIGNVISPMEQLEKYGVDAVRYYLIAGLPTYGDAAYKEDDLINLYNSHLANSLGNLISRVIQLANKKEINLTNATASPEVTAYLADAEQKINQQFDAYELYEAAGTIHDVAMRANKHLDENKPWEAATDLAVAKQVLLDLSVVLHQLIDRYTPLIPTSCAQAKTMLETQEKGILFTKLG